MMYPDEIEFEVTEADFQAGYKRSANSCPLAIAATRDLKLTHRVNIFAEVLSINYEPGSDDSVYYQLDPAAVAAYQAFDREGKHSPGKYTAKKVTP